MTSEPKIDFMPAQDSLERVKAALKVSDAIGFQMAMADTIQTVSLRVGVLARELLNEDQRLGTDDYRRLSQRMKQAEGLLNNVVRALDDMRSSWPVTGSRSTWPSGTTWPGSTESGVSDHG